MIPEPTHDRRRTGRSRQDQSERVSAAVVATIAAGLRIAASILNTRSLTGSGRHSEPPSAAILPPHRLQDPGPPHRGIGPTDLSGPEIERRHHQGAVATTRNPSSRLAGPTPRRHLRSLRESIAPPTHPQPFTQEHSHPAPIPHPTPPRAFAMPGISVRLRSESTFAFGRNRRSTSSEYAATRKRIATVGLPLETLATGGNGVAQSCTRRNFIRLLIA